MRNDRLPDLHLEINLLQNTKRSLQVKNNAKFRDKQLRIKREKNKKISQTINPTVFGLDVTTKF
jgi:hypothetical protein